MLLLLRRRRRAFRPGAGRQEVQGPTNEKLYTHACVILYVDDSIEVLDWKTECYAANNDMFDSMLNNCLLGEQHRVPVCVRVDPDRVRGGDPAG